MFHIGIITDIVDIITSLIGGIIAWLVEAANGLTAIFYTTGEDGGFTVIGVFLLLALGFTIVFFVFNFIRGLMQR